MSVKRSWSEKGYVDEPVAAGLDLQKAIRALCKEKRAVILAHYYVDGLIQDVADFVGDSLALARAASNTDADVIVMCGVHFMAETCKLLNPEKLVLLPDVNAGCSLADSCRAEDLRAMKADYPGYQVVSYVNTTAAVKALTDVVCTSGNALRVVESIPEDVGIIFAPDYNLGSYISGVTGREMVLWRGGCHVHERFSVESLLRLKGEHSGAVVLAHPECKSHILSLADVVGSTAVLLDYVVKSEDADEFIVCTEPGILHEMRRHCPEKTFYPVEPEVSEGSVGCSCNECEYMKLNSMEKLYNALLYEYPSVDIDASLMKDALRPIARMLEI